MTPEEQRQALTAIQTALLVVYDACEDKPTRSRLVAAMDAVSAAMGGIGAGG